MAHTIRPLTPHFPLPLVERLAARPGRYAGVGSRETPHHIIAHLRALGSALGTRGFELWTGGAEGADAAWLEGVLDGGGAAVVFEPWPGFLARSGAAAGVLDGALVALRLVTGASPEAYVIAQRHHPGWARLGRGPRALHARNVHQVLGEDCRSPVRFVACWTPDGADGTWVPVTPATGGTGQAIRIAAAHGIPVLNLAQPAVSAELQRVLGVSPARPRPPPRTAAG